MTTDEISYLVRRANQFGLEGQKLIRIVPPANATQTIEDTVFIIQRNEPTSATEG